MLKNKSLLIKRYEWLLVILCAVSLFLFLGETLFNTRGSSREAVVALTMLKSGNWILPINNGVDMAYKPPFMHWLIALFSLPFGQVTEYTSRLPSALSLSVIIVICFRFFAKHETIKKSFLASLIMLTCFEMHRAGESCRVDMVLTCMIVLSLLCLFNWIERGLKNLPWAGIFFLSCAFLSKGPVGVALPCFVIFFYACIKRINLKKIFLRLVIIGLLSCILPLLWYVAAWHQGGDAFLQLIYEENILRLIGKMSYESHINPWYYNVMTVTLGFLPYTLLVIVSLFSLPWKRVWERLCTMHKNFVKRLRSMDDARLFSLLSIVLIFIFYCIPKSKRSVYLLPIYPFLAYFLAEYILFIGRKYKRILCGYGYFLVSLTILLIAVFSVIRMGIIPENMISGKHPDESRAMLVSLRDSSLNVLQYVSLLLPLLAAYWYVHSSLIKRDLIKNMVGLTFSIMLVLDGVFLPFVLNTKSDKPVAEQIARIIPNGRLYSFRTDITPGNPLHPFTINFYLGDRIVPFEKFMPNEGYVLIGNDEATDFQKRYPQYRLVETIDFKHRSCDDHKYLHLYQFKKL